MRLILSNFLKRFVSINNEKTCNVVCFFGIKIKIKKETLFKKFTRNLYKLFRPRKYFIKNELENIKVPPELKKFFLEMPKGSICLDCGSHIGDITELFSKCGGYVYAFEPNSELIERQKKRFAKRKNIQIINKAVWDKYTTLNLKALKVNNIMDLSGSSIVEIDKINAYEQEDLEKGIEVIDLIEFIKENFSDKNKKVYILKLDIEGAEFEIIEKLLTTGVYKNIELILCETHERFFKDGKKRKEKLLALIDECEATNFYLEWV